MTINDRPLTRHIRRHGPPPTLSKYEDDGGYASIRTMLTHMTPGDVQREVTDSNLRGRGGAGFSTGKKWSFVPMGDDAPRPKYLVVNADEMEPGSFKDRLLLEGHPHQLIESIIIAAYAIQAEYAYIFVRWAYRSSVIALEQALREAREAGLLGRDILGSGFSLTVHVHTSAGRYICGEETALLNALEGHAVIPRAKPPYPQVCGLWGKPTVVQNVETLCNLPHILAHGAEWYKGLGKGKDAGTKLYAVSGRVKQSGVWELPIGTTAREILENHAGGMQEGYTFRAMQTGGGSTGFLTEAHLDVAMDFESLSSVGTRLGTGTAIVLDDRTCPVGFVRNLEHFFAQESCGWCTPCRDGLPWVERLLGALDSGHGSLQDMEILERHVTFLGPGKTYCAHAPGAMEPLKSALQHFRSDFTRHIDERGCPWRLQGTEVDPR
jgi:NADH-quinone oxidoreductase subunit F